MLKKYTIIVFILFNLICIKIYALNDTLKVDSVKVKLIEKFTVGRILLIGNDVTNDDVILREIKTKEGGKFKLDILENDVNRLNNLGLFNRIDVIPAPISDTSLNLVFEFEELFYFLPVPQGGIKEGSFKKIWGGLNFQWKNFRGMNETLNLSFGVGYEPFIYAGFKNPWIFGDSHLFYQFGVKYSRSYPRSTGISTDTTVRIFNKDDVPTYTLDNFQSDLRIGKYFGEYLSLSGILMYNSLSTSDYEPGKTLNENGKDRFPTISADLTYDSRDYMKFATFGSYYNVNYSRIGLFSSVFDLNKFRVDLRKYVPIRILNDYSVTLSARFNTVLSFGGGEFPVYLRESIGYMDMIRGWDNYVLEGEDKVLGSLELRIPVVKPFYVKGKDHFIVKKMPVFKYLSYRYGLYATLFFDVGGVWAMKEQPVNTRFRNGFGAGLNFLLPLDFVFRTDLAFKKVRDIYKGQIIFSLDSSF